MAIGTTELVLGGEGLIGAELVKVLLARGHEVVSLDLKSGCDLRYVGDLPFEECDRVWFLAWDTGGAKYHPVADKQHQMYKHNCELSARVFDALAVTGRPFLFVTSQLAGQPTAYGMTKLMAEKWAAQLGGKVARLWNTYGWEHPDTRSHVVTDLALSGLVEGRVKTMTDGKERRRFIYKSDCVDALIRFFDSSKMAVEIAGEEWFTIGQVAEEIARQLNVEIAFGQKEGEEVMVDPVDTLPGWRQSVSLKDGVAMVVADAQTFLKQEGDYVKRRAGELISA
jgi:nucleoside-diphosphate-sugar epimerase